MEDVVIVGGVRTAVGTMNGGLKDVHQADLGALVIMEVLRRLGVDGKLVDEVIVGNVGQVAESGFIARMCSLKAGLPLETTAYSVNRQCGSGLQAVNCAVQAVQSGNAEVVVACGTENMNQLPYYVRKARFGYRFGHGQFEDGLLTILTWPMGPYPNGVTAENIAQMFHISREEQDAFALESQRKAAAAIKAGKFEAEIVSVEIPGKGDVKLFRQDEHPRIGLTMEQLARLKPAFREGGSVTPGNSSGINDGAGAVLVMSARRARELELKPLLLIRSQAVAGVDPSLMGIGPIQATEKAVAKAGLRMDDIGLFEVNEAFASQSIQVVRALNIPMERVNVNGGAIALGHPIGATGAILTVKLQGEMARRRTRYGVVTMCIGGGQGIATVFENIA